jgi:ubiquitin C-terminal hydrolase
MVVLNIPARKETRSVEPVIIALEQMYQSRISRNQQDSQEFLHLIHEALSLEDTKLKKQVQSENTDDEKEKPDPDTESTGITIPINPFEGDLSTQIECRRCGFITPWKKEPFTELSVAVPSKVPSIPY